MSPPVFATAIENRRATVRLLPRVREPHHNSSRRLVANGCGHTCCTRGGSTSRGRRAPFVESADPVVR